MKIIIVFGIFEWRVLVDLWIELVNLFVIWIIGISRFFLMEVFENLSKLDWRIVFGKYLKKILRFRPFIVFQISINNDIKCYTSLRKNRTASLTLKYRRIFFDFFYSYQTHRWQTIFRDSTLWMCRLFALVSRFINSVARAATSLHNPRWKRSCWISYGIMQVARERI